MPFKGKLAAGIILVLALVSRTAWSGGFEIPDNVTRAMGRGGAYASAVMEPSALYYNPAALCLIDGFATTLDLNLWFYNATFQRAPFTTEVLTGIERTYPFEQSENLDPFFPEPSFFLSYDFGLEDWGFGLGIYGPSAIGQTRYVSPDLEVLRNIDNSDTSPRDWGHAYMLEESDIIMLFFSGAAAYNFGPVQLGITLQLAWKSASLRAGSDGGGTFDPLDRSREEPSLYAPSVVDVTGVAPAGIIGLRYQPLTPLTLSLSYRPRIVFKASGTAEATVPLALQEQVQASVSDATLTLTLPDVIRFGARWAFFRHGTELADLELDLVYEAWSVTKEFNVDIDGEVVIGVTDEHRQIPNRVIPKGYDDTLQVRLGSDVHVTPAWTVRAGGYIEGAANSHFFEQGSTRPGYTNLDFTSFSRIAITLGASYQIADFSIDLALMHVFSPTVTEDDGKIDIFLPQWICNDPQTPSDIEECNARTTSPTHAVNEGVYDVSYDLISLGLTYHWNP